MDSFSSSAAAFAIILGLGVARILSSSVAAFKSRNRAKLTWIPFVWAGCIFIWQLQYWWAIIELPNLIEVWTLQSFLLLVGLALLLFVSASLILPSSELGEHDHLNELFEQNGQWGLLSLSMYFMLAMLADWILWDLSIFSKAGAINGTLAVLPILFIVSRSKRVEQVITLVNVPFSLWAAWVFSPSAYH
jgi:hypothetical protein